MTYNIFNVAICYASWIACLLVDKKLLILFRKRFVEIFKYDHFVIYLYTTRLLDNQNTGQYLWLKCNIIYMPLDLVPHISITEREQYCVSRATSNANSFKMWLLLWALKKWLQQSKLTACQKKSQNVIHYYTRGWPGRNNTI